MKGFKLLCAGTILSAVPAFATLVTATVSATWQNGVASGPDIRLFTGSSTFGVQQFGDNTTNIRFVGNSVTNQPTGQTFLLGTLIFDTSALAADGGSNTADLGVTSDAADPAFQGPSAINVVVTVFHLANTQPGDDPTLFEFAGRPDLGGFVMPGLSHATVQILGQFNSIDLVGFGAVTGPGTLVAPAVPEPATWSMLLIAAVGFGFKRRRRLETRR